MTGSNADFSFLADKDVLVTGGTGSFGRKFVEMVLARSTPRRLIVYSRDEHKQLEMRQTVPGADSNKMRYFLGDVRDVDRLRRAFRDVDVVVHAAALKQVPACEYNPIEAVMTNIMGARNIIDAAIDQGVPHVLALSTDKAVNPANIYGATKLCAEKLFVQANSYAGDRRSIFACSRYGNVLGSRGSVVPLFRQQRLEGRVTVTDRRMTRFWLTLEDGVVFVAKCLNRMKGGELFVPKLPSMRVTDLVTAIAPDCRVEEIGIRHGEKLHEALISEEEARDAVDQEDMYVIASPHTLASGLRPSGPSLPEGFRYTSDMNDWWLSVDELKRMAETA